MTFGRNDPPLIPSIYVLKQIPKKAKEFNTPDFFCFIDLTRAFDRLTLEDVPKKNTFFEDI